MYLSRATGRVDASIFLGALDKAFWRTGSRKAGPAVAIPEQRESVQQEGRQRLEGVCGAGTKGGGHIRRDSRRSGRGLAREREGALWRSH